MMDHPHRFLTWLLVLLILAGCAGRTPGMPPVRTATGTGGESLPPPTDLPAPTGTLTQPRESTPTLTPTRAPLSLAVTPGGKPGTKLKVFFSSGQTFLTWTERADLSGEVYRVYRSDQPIDARTISQAAFLAQVGKGSARFYAGRRTSSDVWGPRYFENVIIRRGQPPLPDGTGLLVWTLAAADFGGQKSGTGYYAVTITPPGGKPTFSADYTTGPVKEAVDAPQPVEISLTPNVHPGPGGHFYIQYMDLRHWNATFHAPNSTNRYMGYDPKDPSLKDALAYAYDYAVFEPSEEMCGGKVPDTLPVMVYLHGWRNNRYPTPFTYDNPSCAYGVYPIDESETWYFGFAAKHDYRKGGPIGKDDVIANFTEQRVLRMVYDLLRKPPGPKAAAQRVYVSGQSMGGTGSLAFAERYPNVFAAAYAGEPMTDFRTSKGTQDFPADAAVKWGDPALNLPVSISAPAGWADHLQKYNGVGVWDWENLQAAFAPGTKRSQTADDMAPFGVDHGSRDLVIPFQTQTQPFYPLLNASMQAWAGAVIDAEHTWTNFGYPPVSLSKVDGVPFWKYGVIRDETVPGFSFTSTNDPNPPAGPTTYNQTLFWSASWFPWDGPPVDTPTEWRMSFCANQAPLKERCGSAAPLTVDITPRRLQHFVVKPGMQFTWENRRADALNTLYASGVVTADENGLVTVKGFKVDGGNRLIIKAK